MAGALGAQPAAATEGGRPERPLKVPPLQHGSAARTGLFKPLQPFELVPTSKSKEPGLMQLRNRRTGVTCTLLIVPVEPSVDAGMLVTTSDHHLDPIVRNDLSPCHE
jgi:hypothetical protein